MGYGFPYQGSKQAIAKDILDFLPSGKRLVDLFGGGGAISHCATLKYTEGLLKKWNLVLYNEINPLNVSLLKDAINGKYNPETFKPRWISREEFEQKKNEDAYIKYIWSFSNNGVGYMFGKDVEPAKRAVHNAIVNFDYEEYKKLGYDESVFDEIYDVKERRHRWKKYFNDLHLDDGTSRLEQLERLQQLELSCGSYVDYRYIDGDIVYCDIPYEKTNCGTYNSFDNQAFYDWCCEQPFQVYISSYTISDDRFVPVWEKPKRVLSTGKGASKSAIERIFIKK